MATPKTWTANDIDLATTTLSQDDDGGVQIIRFEQRYLFVDDLGNVIPEIAIGRYVGIMPVSSVPANIITALSTIKSWLYQKCLEQEGMQDA